jgi:hypothetical protein
VSGGPSLAWVGEACTVMLATDAAMGALVRWLGEDPAAAGDRLRLGPGVLPGVVDVSVLGEEGVPRWLSAWYAAGEGPSLREAEAALGPSRELVRMPDGPCRLAFPPALTPDAECVIGAATWDPPGGERRLVEIVVRRDPR